MKRLSPPARSLIAAILMWLIILFSLSLVLSGFYRVYYAPEALFGRALAQEGEPEEHFSGHVINVAFFGLHNREDDNTFGEIYNVDTLLLLRLDFNCNLLTLVAVPRDSLTTIACTGHRDKIRNAYRRGFLASAEERPKRHEAGLNCALQTAAALLQPLEIDYYLALDLQGVKQLIDAMGGVFFEVEAPIEGPSPRESLKAGPQQLDGQGFITYLTYTEFGQAGDLKRISRQKRLLRYSFKYFKEKGLFSYVLPVYAAYREHIRTDLSLNQVAALALFFSERLEHEAIISHVLTGNYKNLNAGQGLILEIDEKAKDKLLQSMLSHEEAKGENNH